jgi:hypothetical protein
MNYAKLDGNTVVNIEVADRTWIEAQPNKEDYIEYTIDNPAIIGGDYIDGYFYPIKPFESWSRDGKGNWVAPKPKPDNENFYFWNDEILDWDTPITF